MGYYDATAIIDYILQVNGQEKVFYIGHSQGTTAFFAMAAARPEYNDKIRLMSALAPVTFMENIPSTLLQQLAKSEVFLSVSVSGFIIFLWNVIKKTLDSSL